MHASPISASIVAACCTALAATVALAEAVVGDRPQSAEDRYVGDPPVTVESWVEGLEAPWSLVFLPDGQALVSERPGRIRLIEDGRLRGEPYAELDSVGTGSDGIVDFVVRLVVGGEGGLMGLALHPDFPNRPYVYAMYTHDGDGGPENRVIRLEHRGGSGRPDKVILQGIPASRNHNGGRIGFGPDGMLYVATGDAGERELAQDDGSLAGKILRLDPEGGIPRDNPVPGSPLFSLGHRNPQGLAWHAGTGDLFASEHGPTGEFGLRAFDEINVIERGGNFGWPRVVGAAGKSPHIDPIAAWPEMAVPPGGIAFWNDDLFVSTMRSEALLRLGLDRTDGSWKVAEVEHWFVPEEGADGRFGRLRDTVVGPDGALYVLTSNRDGRGSPRDGDDRILRLTRR